MVFLLFRAKVLDLEKKQRNFDKILAEEKLNADRISGERDTAEREARDKETKLLNLNRELDDTLVRLEESERSKRQLQSELDEVVNSQVRISFPGALLRWVNGCNFTHEFQKRFNYAH